MVTHVGDFHRNCFSCFECGKKLDSVTCCEGPDQEIYCKSCYSLEFGTKARSIPRKGSFRRRYNSAWLVTACCLPSLPVYTDRGRAMSVPKHFTNHDDMLARSTVETWVIKAEKGDPDCCPKCDGRVFEAEKMVTAAGHWYHKNCFRCVECERLLDSLTSNDGSG